VSSLKKIGLPTFSHSDNRNKREVIAQTVTVKVKRVKQMLRMRLGPALRAIKAKAVVIIIDIPKAVMSNQNIGDIRCNFLSAQLLVWLQVDVDRPRL
jgi:hypothetical protein